MKIDLDGAMEELHQNKNIKDGYSDVRVTLKRFDGGEEGLIWNLYGYDALSDDSNSEWSGDSSTFDEALTSLVSKFEKARKPEERFVEKD